MVKKQKEEAPVWNLYKHGVSASGINKFLECREQFRLMYKEGLSSKWSSKYLDYGNAVHSVLAKAGTKLKNKRPPTNAEIEGWLNEYKAEHDLDYSFKTPADREEFDYTMGCASVVLYHYFQRWHAADSKTKWLHLEEPFTVPFSPTPDFHLPVPINGTWDGIFENTAGEHWCMDTKTKSTINEENITDLFSSELQFNLYLWSYKQQTGKSLAGLRLNIVRKPGMTVTQKDGSLNAMLARLDEDIGNRPDFYFLRPFAQFTASETRVWAKTQLTPMMLDIVDWFEGRGRHYVNYAALIKNQVRSEFFDAIVHGDYSGLRKSAHWMTYLKD